jgi:hypothetical protein
MFHFKHSAYFFHNYIATVKIFSVSFDTVFGITNTFIQSYAFLNNLENVIYSKCPLNYKVK